MPRTVHSLSLFFPGKIHYPYTRSLFAVDDGGRDKSVTRSEQTNNVGVQDGKRMRKTLGMMRHGKGAFNLNTKIGVVNWIECIDKQNQIDANYCELHLNDKQKY